MPETLRAVSGTTDTLKDQQINEYMCKSLHRSRWHTNCCKHHMCKAVVSAEHWEVLSSELENVEGMWNLKCEMRNWEALTNSECEIWNEE